MDFNVYKKVKSIIISRCKIYKENFLDAIKAIILIFLFFTIVLVLLLNLGLLKSIPNAFDELGVFGDWAGGILNPIFSLMGIFLFVRAIKLQNIELKIQRKELTLQRRELKASVEALQEQKEEMIKQNSYNKLIIKQNIYFSLCSEFNEKYSKLAKEDGKIAIGGDRIFKEKRVFIIKKIKENLKKEAINKGVHNFKQLDNNNYNSFGKETIVKCISNVFDSPPNDINDSFLRFLTNNIQNIVEFAKQFENDDRQMYINYIRVQLTYYQLFGVAIGLILNNDLNKCIIEKSFFKEFIEYNNKKTDIIGRELDEFVSNEL